VASAQAADETLDALVAAGEVLLDAQILPDALRRKPRLELTDDYRPIVLAAALSPGGRNGWFCASRLLLPSAASNRLPVNAELARYASPRPTLLRQTLNRCDRRHLELVCHPELPLRQIIDGNLSCSRWLVFKLPLLAGFE
jgi:hypothetical protein